MDSKKKYWLALVIFCIVFFVGAYMRSISMGETKVYRSILRDAKDYFSYAYNLVYNHTYSRDFGSIADPGHTVKPDAHRNPGYPLFLAPLMDAEPTDKTIIKIVFAQLIVSCLTLALAYYLYCGFLPRFLALISASLTALSPHLIIANSYILTETLFCFFLVLTGALVRFFISRPSHWRCLMMGACLGAGFLVRPSLLYFPVVVMLVLILQFGRKRGLSYFAGVLAGFILLAAPWFVRNIVSLQTISDPSLKLGFLHHGLYPNFTFDNMAESYGFPYRFDPRAGEIGKNTATILKEIFIRFRTRPAEHFKWFLYGKPVAFWSWNMVQGQGDVFVYPVKTSPYHNRSLFKWSHSLMRAAHKPLVALALAACLLVWLPGRMIKFDRAEILIVRFLSALLLYFTALHMIGAPFPRYSIPLRPVLFGMAMWPLAAALKGSRSYGEKTQVDSHS